MFVGSTFLAKNTKGIAKGPKTKPIIAQKVLFEPLLAAIKYNKPAKQKEVINKTKYPIAKPFHIQGTIRSFVISSFPFEGYFLAFFSRAVILASSLIILFSIFGGFFKRLR